MMVNLASVGEETDNETPVEIPRETSDDDEKEEKVRVDRRKLEQMLQVNGDADGPNAEEFFTKIMVETNTRISWPSKLKIGAKSKKDPHIKIAGKPENITTAKERVVAVLESKANRVTLKMDVSHTDHSHIIGRKGHCIKKVMEETGCHIHFPDSNRGSATTEKSNQVSIAGQPEGVERARTRIRELLPLVLMFEIPFSNTYIPFDISAPAIESIARRYDVTFALKGRSPHGSLIIVVRGSQNNVSNIQEAMGYLCEHLTGHFQIPSVVSLQLDIAPQHHVFVVGRAGCNIKHITDSTGTKIDFPDPSSVSRKGTVTIAGNINGVIQARTSLVKYLPMLLMFDLKEGEAAILAEEPDKLKKIMDKFCVTIMVKPKQKQTSKSVVIKSMESNSQNMYLTRLEILGTPMNPHTTQHPSFTTIHRQSPEPKFFFPSKSLQWFQGINQSPYLSPVSSPTPRTDSPVSMPKSPSPPRLPPPGFEHCNQHRRSESFNNADFSVFTGESDATRTQGTMVSENDSPKQSMDFNYTRRNSEPTAMGDSWSGGQGILNKTRTGSTSSLVSSGAKNAIKGAHLVASHGTDPASSLDSLHGSLSYNFDRFLNLTPQKKFLDREKQIGIANEAITQNLSPQQVRTPTDQWSGLHLSKSTPTGALRKPLRKGPLHFRHGVPLTDELQESDEDSPMRQDFSASVTIPSQYSRRDCISPFQDSKNDGHEPMNLLKSFHPKDTALYDILKLYGVESFAQKLEDLEIDFATFITLTKEDLKEAGVEPLGARKKMEHAIKDMKMLQDKAIENDFKNRAMNFRVENPLEFSSRSGHW